MSVQRPNALNADHARPVLRVVSTASGLQDLHPEWQELLGQCVRPNVFLTWEWISTWFSHFGNGCALRILVVRAAENNRVLGIAPFAIYTHRLAGLIRSRELRFAGHELAPDHMDLLFRRGHECTVTTAVLDWIREESGYLDVILLNALSTDSPLVPRLADGPGHSWHHRHEILCPVLELASNPSAWLAGLPKKRRYKIRRGLRQLQAALPDPVHLQCIENESQLADGLSTLIRLHRATRDAKRTGNGFPDRRYVDFHRELSALFLRQGWLRLYLLRAGDRAIAAAYCFRYDSTVSFYSTGYSDAFSRFSPGMTLLVQVVERSISEGAARFDFLRGDEAYKFIFTQDVVRDLQVRLPSSLTGRLVTRLYDLGRERIRPALRSIISSRR